MQYKQFGKNGPMVSRLGFGCMRLPAVGEGEQRRCDDEACIPILRRAYELGINFFDTAWGYTNRDNQRVVGKAVHDFRDKIYLSSKLPPSEVQQPGDFRRKLEHSLRLMDTDYLDFYHMHALNAQKFEHAKKMQMDKDMLKAKDEGLIRHISFSFHDAPRVMVDIAEKACQVTPEERRAYKATNDKLKGLSELYCSGCAYCNVCPQGIKPQQHFKAYNRARVWGLYDAARKDYLADGLDKEAETCLNCGACAAECPQKIGIPEKLAEIRDYFTK